MVTFTLPSQLHALAGGQRSLAVDACTLGEALRKLDEAAPMIRSQLFDAAGRIRQFVSIFLNDQQVPSVGDGTQAVREGSQIVIVMAVAGG